MSSTYLVSMSQLESAKLRDWDLWANLHSQRIAFRKALAILNFRLMYEPMEIWSEPYQDLEILGLQLRFGSENMLGVGYGVHAASRQIFVKRFQWLGSLKPPG